MPYAKANAVNRFLIKVKKRRTTHLYPATSYLITTVGCSGLTVCTFYW